ncbi:glycosyltransferase family 2 protein [Aliarcobacter cryaerophilus]|uniref:Glycosyltransferase family 2 protein n=2 Tax=unclassified Arcobacter TaxID=2593671 RepID=A0AA96I784_9BACT|nr:glycosyltransferase family 2 protein [Arcobacter sp. AZ-2023]WPD09455.1 glycosyltransferase family 2 protein [Arcobacter sp. DSM 115954]WNL14285.1 glycosyltransferase family 2 protein [Arcobacter sp. AZ-2023]WNL19832.1 glycosyltransferase family 2 protein [Arcobacter sp. AZ-2023]WNL21973.1 glycosyltransferase family 2 protein [Arcobacter sp. AZ-2023]
MKNIDLSFITINYNSSILTIKLIESIVAQTKDLSFEIIIVDNASKKDDLFKLKNFVSDKINIKLIENSINSGFASGNMLGVNYALGKYYFFINNDCILLNNTSKILKDFLDFNEDVGLATAKVLDNNGNYSSSYKQFPHLIKQLFGNSIQRIISKNRFPSNKIKLEKNSEVEVISGSCMFFRRDVFCSIGGFDTAFFLYCEEEDICKRVWNFGKKVYFIPKAEVFHEAGGSTEKSFQIEREFYISYYHLLDKHYNFLGIFLLKIALFIKLFFRIFKKKNGFKMFLAAIQGFSIKSSLRYQQKVNN